MPARLEPRQGREGRAPWLGFSVGNRHRSNVARRGTGLAVGMPWRDGAGQNQFVFDQFVEVESPAAKQRLVMTVIDRDPRQIGLGMDEVKAAVSGYRQDKRAATAIAAQGHLCGDLQRAGAAPMRVQKATVLEL